MRLTPFVLTQNIATDNALSTIQVIHKLINQMNKIIDEVNSIDSKANQYTDEQIVKLKAELVDKFENDINSLNDSLTKFILENDNQLKEELLLELNSKVNKIYTDVEKIKNDLYLYIDNKDNQIIVKLYDIYNELLDLIKNGNSVVYSAVDGNLKNVQDCLYDIVSLIQNLTNLTYDNIVSLCSGDSDYLQATLINSVGDIESTFYCNELPAGINIDYLNINGLRFACSSEITKCTINGIPITYEGSGVLIPLSLFTKYNNVIVIKQVNYNYEQEFIIKNSVNAVLEVTYDSINLSLINPTKSGNYNNYNSLSYYNVEFCKNHLIDIKGNHKDINTNNLLYGVDSRNYFNREEK